jgi:hypothetical protein
MRTTWLTLDGEHATSDGMPSHYIHVFHQLEHFNIDLRRHAERIEAESWPLFVPPLPCALPADCARVERQFRAADWLAIHFQRRVRMSLLTTHTIAALMGLAFIFFSDVETSRFFLVAFLVLFAIGFVVTMLGERREWQRKYLDYRGLAEGLRVQLFWRMAGVEIPPNSSLGYDSFLQKQDVDLSWIRHAMRGTGLLRDESFVPDLRWRG